MYRFFDNKAGAQTPKLPAAEDNTPPDRIDFDRACEELAERGLVLCSDLDVAWQQYQELRSRYASALEFMGRLTMAPGTKTVR